MGVSPQIQKRLPASSKWMIRTVESGEMRGITTLIGNTLLLSNTGTYSIEEVHSLIRTYSEAYLSAVAGKSFTRVHANGGRIDGFVCLEGESLQALFVAPDAQRRGIGRALVAAAQEHALGLKRVHLRVAASLTAVGFYEHLGFEQQGRGRTSYGVPIAWMIKQIRP